jgi:hypothetical protein
MPIRQMAIAVASALLLSAQTATAQQTFNVTLGYLTVRGEDARVDRDVLNENRNFLVFDISEFNGLAAGAEWLVPLGAYVEAGAGVAFSRRTVPTVYEAFVDIDGSEIEQDLRLRMLPIAFTLRLLPLGQSATVQPYLGGGIAVVNWRYSEAGEFIDFQNQNAIFREQYAASGNATGPVVLGGLRFAGSTVSSGFEVRYHSADADLGARFASAELEPRIDLGGWTYQFTVGLRFGR